MSFPQLLSVVFSYEALHWQAQLLVLVGVLPTIIVSLTPYPKEQGWAKTLLTILNLFSVASHRDSPQPLKPPIVQSRPPAVVGSPISSLPKARRGVVLLEILPLLVLAAVVSQLVGCAAVSWGAPAISSGPSVQLVEISPSNPHPVQIAAGAGYSVSLGEAQIAIAGKQWDLLDVSLQAIGAVVAPQGLPAGAIQIAPMIGTLNDTIAVGPIFTPYTAAGAGGFLQGGRPGTAWGVHLTFPIGLGPYAPPTGIEEGPAGLPRGGTLYLP